MPGRTATAPETRFLSLPRPDGTAGRIAYDDRGEGPLVLLAPGMGDLRATFRFLAPLLVDAGYRVVSVDYRGLGGSDIGWDEYSSAATGRDLAALLRHLNAGPALLYGNSYTAASAVHVAADAPDLLRGVVLAGPFVREPRPTLFGRLTTFLVTKPALTRTLWFAWWPRMFPIRPADYDAYLAQVRANLKEPGRTRAYAAMCGGTHAPAAAKLPAAKACGLPFLVLMGSADADFPDAAAEARWIGDTLDCRVELLTGSGHHPQVDAPERVADLIAGFDPQAPAARQGA